MKGDYFLAGEGRVRVGEKCLIEDMLDELSIPYRTTVTTEWVTTGEGKMYQEIHLVYVENKYKQKVDERMEQEARDWENSEVLPHELEVLPLNEDGTPQITCPSCGEDIDFDYPKCPHCNQPVSAV